MHARRPRTGSRQIGWLVAAALATAAGAFAAGSDDCDAAYMAGYQRMQAGEHAEAVADFERALAAADVAWRRGACHYRLGECLEKLGELEKAVDHYDAASRSTREDRFADDLGRQRYIGDAIKRLGRIAGKAGRGETARAAIEAYLEHFPRINSNERANAYGWVAEALVSEGRLDEAAEYIEARIGDDRYVTPDAAQRMRDTLEKHLARARR